jgi:hypothetical protein
MRPKVIVLLTWSVLAMLATAKHANADPFTDLGDGLTRITGLRGVIKGLAGGASEGVREQLDKFVDEEIDPLVSRVDQILHDRIQQATDSALLAIHEMEHSMQVVIDQAARDINILTNYFFAELDRTLDETFSRLEGLFDVLLCRIMPDGHIDINLGPFGGSDEITVRRPARTQCYRDFLASQGDPGQATFRRWEYFAGELCENELRLNRIEPEDPESIAKSIRGYQKLAEMANTARCAAPDPSSKVLMARKLYLYQFRAEFFSKLMGVLK